VFCLELLLNLLVQLSSFRSHELIFSFKLLHFLLLLFEVLVHFVLESLDVVLELFVGADSVLIYFLINLCLLLSVKNWRLLIS